MTIQNILFVCTGNTCRSPMAEALFKQLSEMRGIKLVTRSAGIAASSGESLSDHAVRTLKTYMVTHQGMARLLTEEDVNWADLILTMTVAHQQHIILWHPEAVNKTHTLKQYVADEEKANAVHSDREWNIVDPFGGSLETYEVCAREIHYYLTALLDKLLKGNGSCSQNFGHVETEGDETC